MTAPPEFFFEAIGPGTKGVYPLSLPFGEDLENLEGQINLASSGLSSKKEIF
jgi:hypothetical protein